MGAIQKILNKKTELSDKLGDYIKDDSNIMYLCGLMTGSVTIAGLTYICEGKYLDGCGALAASYLLNKYSKYVKRGIKEKQQLRRIEG